MQIRNSSHYRNPKGSRNAYHFAPVKALLANGGDVSSVRQGTLFLRPLGGAFTLSFFSSTKERNDQKMKKQCKIALLCMLSLCMIFCLFACAKVEKTGVWENATYRSDKTFGDGGKTVLVEVKAEEQSITFTVKTDEEMLGDALLAHGLIAGEEGPYGLYLTHVNGMAAIWEENKSYWGIYANGEYLLTGVDTTPVEDGQHYELVYTK